MRVILQKAWTYFLIKDRDRYYISAYYSRGSANFSVVFQLNSDETSAYHEYGAMYIEALARKVNTSLYIYQSRQLDKAVEEQIHAAIMAWNHTNSNR